MKSLGTRLKENWSTLAMLTVLVFAGYLGYAQHERIVPHKNPKPITATTATAEGYLEAAKVLTGEETKWKTIEVEEFDPNKTDTEYSTDDGLVKRTTTSLYFDDRVKPVAKKK